MKPKYHQEEFLGNILTIFPVVIMVSAISVFTSRGRRCVPPAPGIRPMSTSGKPSDALGEATLK